MVFVYIILFDDVWSCLKGGLVLECVACVKFFFFFNVLLYFMWICVMGWFYVFLLSMGVYVLLVWIFNELRVLSNVFNCVDSSITST